MNCVCLAVLGSFHIRLKNKTNYNLVLLAAGKPQRPDLIREPINQAIMKQRVRPLDFPVT